MDLQLSRNGSTISSCALSSGKPYSLITPKRLVRFRVRDHSFGCSVFQGQSVHAPDSSSLTSPQGRSPFDPPLQDENGEFILGPNVQHDTRRDYIQDFDSRGHPRNIASQISRRRLLRAQNEALSTVGVVVRKAKANRTHWQTMSKQEKFDIVVEENTVGAYLGIAESILQKLSTQWILNLRQRVLVSSRLRISC